MPPSGRDPPAGRREQGLTADRPPEPVDQVVEEQPHRERPWKKRWFALVVGIHLLLALVLTWPLILHVSSSTPSRWWDSKISTWVMAWDAHALATHPTALFHAPIFYPAPDALAYTDHLLGLAIFAAPINWVTGNPYLAHNIVFLLSAAFAGFAASLAAWELTRNRLAAIIGGVAYQASPYWYGSILNTAHIQIVASGWMLMACFALLRWWRLQRRRDLLLLATSFVMASLTTWHQATFLAVILGIIAVCLFIAAPPRPIPRFLGKSLVAAAVAGLVLVPFILPYRSVEQRDPNYGRTISQVQVFSANASSYLAADSSNLLYGSLTTSMRTRSPSFETHLFPGLLVVLLAGVGVAWTLRNRASRALGIAMVVIVGVGVVLSLGASKTGFRRHLPWLWLSQHLAPFRGIRASSRAHMMTVLGLAMLAAMGSGAVLRRTKKHRTLVAGLLMAILVLEGWSAPLKLGTAPRPDPIYATLASRSGGFLELPTVFPGGGVAAQEHEFDYMMYQTAYWGSLVNGYSGYTPPVTKAIRSIVRELPKEPAVDVLRRYRIHTLIVHGYLLAGTPWEGLEAKLTPSRDFRLLARSAGISIYDVVGP